MKKNKIMLDKEREETVVFLEAPRFPRERKIPFHSIWEKLQTMKAKNVKSHFEGCESISDKRFYPALGGKTRKSHFYSFLHFFYGECILSDPKDKDGAMCLHE